MTEKNTPLPDSDLNAIAGGGARTFDQFLAMHGKQRDQLSGDELNWYIDRFGTVNYNVGYQEGEFKGRTGGAGITVDVYGKRS